MFGYAAEEIVGKPAPVLLGRTPMDRRHTAGATMSWPLSAGAPVEALGRRHNGTLFPIELALSEMTVEDETGFVLLARDISAR